MWATAMYGGLRAGELQGLRWGDVDLTGGFLHVRRSIDPQAGEVAPKSAAGIRRVPIPAVLRPHLAAHRLACPWSATDGYVFGRGPERPFLVWTIHKRARRYWTAAKLDPIGLHECRHTMVTLYLAAGTDWLTLSKIAGHSDPHTTAKLYGHLLRDAERKAADRLDTFLGEQATEG